MPDIPDFDAVCDAVRDGEGVPGGGRARRRGKGAREARRGAVGGVLAKFGAGGGGDGVGHRAE